jgi:hypothetical protein
MAEQLTVSPAELQIDELNPRISLPNAGQHKALGALAAHQDTKLQALAEDIVKYGIDPSNLPIVMHQPGSGKYVVLEGNRRLVALRALENPDSIADSVKAQILKRIRKLSREYQANPIESINCVLVASREEARHWMELRHTGLNAGAGLMTWGSDESARFRARTGPIEPHTQAMDFLQSRGDLTPEVRKQVPATSFKRLIESPQVRAKLGVEIEKGELRLLADAERVARALMFVVTDLATKTTKTGDIYTRAQRQKYAKTIPPEVAVTPTVTSGHGTSATSAGAGTKPNRRQKRRRGKRDKLIPTDCTLGIPDGRISDIEYELRRLSLEDHTNAVSVLFRVFVELSVDAYLDDHPLGVNATDKLRKKMDKVATDLEQRKKLNQQQARAIRRSTMTDSFLAPDVDTLNQYVHNQYVFPIAGDLRKHWDSLQPFIAAMWKP